MIDGKYLDCSRQTEELEGNIGGFKPVGSVFHEWLAEACTLNEDVDEYHQYITSLTIQISSALD